MKRWLVVILGVAAGVVVLLLVAGLFAGSLLEGLARDRLVAAVQELAGVPVSLGAVEIELGQWLRLQPAVALEDVAIGNPAGFRGKHVIEAKRISAEVSLAALLRKSLRVHTLAVVRPRIAVETNAQRVTNIEVILKRLSAGGAARPKPASGSAGGDGAVLAIDELRVEGGELVLSAADSEAVRIHGIDVRLYDFRTDGVCRLQAGARLFRGDRSHLKIEARAGPFSSNSLPLAGTLAVTIAPEEIPAALRQKQFGNLLGAPGKGQAGLQASIEGDLYRSVSGPGKLVLSDILVGKDSKRVLPLTGEAALTFAAANAVSDPDFRLAMRDAKLRVGKGEWTGDAEVRSHRSVMSGRSRGKIRNVEINELVSGFTAADDKIFGALEMPAYTLQFSGKDGDELLRSLNGSGELSIANGRIAALDLLASIQRALDRSQQEAEGQKGNTLFHTLKADLRVGQNKLTVDRIQVDGPGLGVSGKGAIDFEHNMQFELEAQVTGGVARLINTVTRRSGPEAASLPVAISGTLEAPRVRPSLGKVASGVARGMLDRLFKKKEAP